jgi:hypothetical protein
MEENDIINEELPTDKCRTCEHRRDQHTNDEQCRQCNKCLKFEQKYDSPDGE